MSQYTVHINNCNSIESAVISITKNALNIKYGPNGLGKSSIARAITSSITNDGSLGKLKPFKHRAIEGESCDPTVSGVEDIKSALVFDDSYVSQFVFQKDEVLKNSFEIFIKNDAFILAMGEIESLLSGIKAAFDGNESLSAAISDLRELRDAFGVTGSGAISKASRGFKAFGLGNKVENIPDHLTPFQDFIKSDQPAAWVLWQTKGNTFSTLSDNCPYCSTSLKTSGNDIVAKSVSETYDTKNIEHLIALQLVIDRLGKYFETSSRDQLKKITKSKMVLTPEESNFLSVLRGDIETLITKLEGLRSISFFKFRDVEKIEEEIEKLRINLDLLERLKSEDTKSLIDPLNDELKDLSDKVIDLKIKINNHKKQIASSIQENQDGINSFLISAGYKYSVSIKPEGESYRMKLLHIDFSEHIETASQHLSYGEKNAFAMVLFMYQVLKEKPDLVILDDPVSSFDKTKKFAILTELFQGKASLRDSTVLMLTHDIEPAIDVIRVHKRNFSNPKPKACFLTSRAGIISELEITSSDIQTFAKVCFDNIGNLLDIVIKCIYLRRYFELLDNHGLEYICLSNLLHGRSHPERRLPAGSVLLDTAEIAEAESSISKYIPDFNYGSVLSIIMDKAEMINRFHSTTAGYDKIQLFRIFKELHNPDSTKINCFLKKFVDGSFHIENEYVMQLNPHKFDNVPEHIIQECARTMSLNTQ